MVYQVSVFLENKIGHLKHITSILHQNKINIRTMNLTHSAHGWGILNMIVDHPRQAFETLNDGKISVALREIIALKMEDHPGGLDKLLGKVEEAGINFTNAYGRILNEGNDAFLVIDAVDYKEATQLLMDVGLQPLDESVVYGI